MTATVTPDASPHGHPIASTNSGANSCPVRKSHSAGTVNATFSSTLSARQDPRPAAQVDEDREDDLEHDQREEPGDPERPQGGVEHRDRLALAVDPDGARLLPDDRDREQHEEHDRRDQVAESPGSGVVAGLRQLSGVHVVAGTEVPGDRSSTAKTRVTQKQRCTPTEIAVPIVVPIISPISAPEMSCASRRPAAEIGTTMTSSSFSSRHQVRK